MKADSKLPLIFTIASCVGVIATGVLSAWGTAKAIEKIEKEPEVTQTKLGTVKATVKYFIPAAVSSMATIACIFASNASYKERMTVYASSAAGAAKLYNDYTQKVKEIYGEQAHQKIIDEIADEKASPDIYLTAPTLCNNTSLDAESFGEKESLFYDSFSKRYFTSKLSKVLQAEYHLNRNYTLGGNVCVNDFYRFLGISEIEDGDALGWDVGGGMEGIYWLDFMHWMKEVNGIDCIVIDMEFSPMIADENY